MEAPNTPPESSAPFDVPFEFFDDIPLTVNVDLGRTTMTVRDILDLEDGSVIEISKSAGDNMEIKVKDEPLALGEIFVIEGSIGVRITEIISDEQEY